MNNIDFLLLTEARYTEPRKGNKYVENIFQEDKLLTDALISKGMTVHRASWDDEGLNFRNYSHSVFRTTWDYFDRFQEFSTWLFGTKSKTHFINSASLIDWNLDKKYLLELSDRGINIPASRYCESGENISLAEALEELPWSEVVLKPAISGAGRHTYRFLSSDFQSYEEIFRTLLEKESLILQEFQRNIITRGEIALMFFGGVYSHSVIKKAKQGEFRVQDDFGGSVENYEPDQVTIDFASEVLHNCPELPVYARVDLIWDNQDSLAVSELELIEPELWLRFCPQSAEAFAAALIKKRQVDQS